MRPRTENLRGGFQSTATWLGVVLVTLVVCLGSPARIVAQEQEQHEEPAEHEGGEEHGEGHHFHKNHIGIVLSSTEGVAPHDDTGHGDVHSEESSGGKDDPAFTLGFDYERRLTQLFGLGVMLEWVVEGNREYLVGPIGFLHPYKGLKLYAAPCYEKVRESGDSEFVVRVGTSWEFAIGKNFVVAPNVNYDMSDAHNLWNVGVAIGRGW